MPVDNRIKQILQELGHALVKMITSSSEVGDAVGRIRQEGYSVYLVLDREDRETEEARIELLARQPSQKEAAFLLDKGDVSLLRSLGIDATRSGKRRRAP